MKLQVFLWGSILVAALFCLGNQSQANLGPPYINPITTPSEHPWQHDNSIEPGDSIYYSTHHIVILPLGFNLKPIWFFMWNSSTKGLTDRPGRLNNDHISELYLRDKR
jgi:hypothetical protein